MGAVVPSAPALGQRGWAAGLQSLGNGLWQYGWKTKGAYKKTCQELSVDLADGVTGRVALFRFG